jgi:Fur family transcriptional regulator, iron response regulator
MHTTTHTRESLPALLRAHGIAPTHQRIEIAHAIFSRGEHVSADRILALTNDRATETSKATVYNTLKLFVARKLIREVIADPGKVFYDPNTEPHHHFYNVDSGELTDIDAREIRVTGLPPLPQGALAEGIDVIVRVRSRVS